MPRINKLPNYYGGKLYERWKAVTPILGNRGIVATKTNNDGKYVQLVLTEKGNKRELLFDNGKIMDTVDKKGTKRTYVYSKDNKNNIRGQMFVTGNEENVPPLITAAKWISRNCIPERLFIKLNPEHSSSKIFIPAQHVKNKEELKYFGNGKLVQATEILAKDFESVYSPMPKTLIIKTNKGDTEAIISKNAEENLQLLTQLEILSDTLGHNLRTMV